MFNPLDGSLDCGPSNFDTPHILVVNAMYEIPFLRGAGGLRTAFLGGWTVTGIYQYQSGAPPNSSACLGCHDTLDAAAHTFVNTPQFGESCGPCHGPQAEFSVERVHAR